MDFIKIFGSFFKFNYERDIYSEIALTILGIFTFLTFIYLSYNNVFTFLVLAYYPTLDKELLIKNIYFDRIIFASISSTIISTFFIIAAACIFLFLNNVCRYTEQTIVSISNIFKYTLSILRIYLVVVTVVILIMENVSLTVIVGSSLNVEYKEYQKYLSFLTQILYIIQVVTLFTLGYLGLGLKYENKRKKILLAVVILITSILSLSYIHIIGKKDIELSQIFNKEKIISITLISSENQKLKKLEKELLNFKEFDKKHCEAAYNLLQKAKQSLHDFNLNEYRERMLYLPFFINDCSKGIGITYSKKIINDYIILVSGQKNNTNCDKTLKRLLQARKHLEKDEFKKYQLDIKNLSQISSSCRIQYFNQKFA